MLGRLGNRWNQIWFEPLAPYPLAAFRIAFGIYLLGIFLKYVSIVELSFSNQGVYSPYLVGDIAPAPSSASAIYYATLLAIAALILGLFTRIATLLVFLLFEYHLHLNFAVYNFGIDRLNVIILIVLCFADSGAAWSLDARWRKAPRFIPAWHIRLLQFQLVALYFGNGLWKVLNPEWFTGIGLQSTLASEYGSPLAFQLLNLPLPDWCYEAATWAVIAFELGAGFGLYWRKTRPWTMLLGILFHLFNTFVLEIPEFLNCIALYALFINFDGWVRHDSTAVQPAPEGLAAAAIEPVASG